MRFLISVSSLTPGSGLSRYVFTLCSLLAEGNEVYVVTTHDCGDNEYESNELKQINSNIKLISLGSKSKFAKYLGAIASVRDIGPDVIINNYNGVFQYILPLISRKIKIVHILHNDTDDFYRIGSINASKVDRWIAPTQAIADHFNGFTGKKYAERVAVIPHGVDDTDYQSRHNDKLEIVYTGVLYEHKGVKILPEIIRKLIRRGIGLHFTIIGGGVLSDWLKEQFLEEINTGTVTMTGVLNHENVYKIMREADIFLYPTHLDAFGLVIAEAMINGAVPVVTWLPGITDNLITHEKDGLLIAKDDIDAFVATISKLSDEENKRKILSQNAHSKAKNCFSMAVMKNNYQNFLNNLV